MGKRYRHRDVADNEYNRRRYRRRRRPPERAQWWLLGLLALLGIGLAIQIGPEFTNCNVTVAWRVITGQRRWRRQQRDNVNFRNITYMFIDTRLRPGL
jgi:hypothetical protein